MSVITNYSDAVKNALNVLEPYKGIVRALEQNDFNEDDYKTFNKVNVLEVCKHKLYYSLDYAKAFILFYLNIFIFHNDKVVKVPRTCYGSKEKYYVLRHENKNGVAIAALYKEYREPRCVIQNNGAFSLKRGIHECHLQLEQRTTKFVDSNIVNYIEEPLINFGDMKEYLLNDDVDGLFGYFYKHPNVLDNNWYRYAEIGCDMNVLQLSILFGAVRCFKRIILEYGYKADKNNSVVAAIGGNCEIFHICVQNNDIDYEIAFINAVKFHRNDIAEYAYIRITPDMNKVIELCVDNFNYEVLEYIASLLPSNDVNK